jgi:predicted small integral membrane protein
MLPIRYLKIVLVAFAALMCLLYATHNVVNAQAAYGFVYAVFSQADNAAYPASIFPVITTPAIVWAALVFICLLEFTAGLVAARGAWELWQARHEAAADFNAAKTWALAGVGLGIVVWFGLFTTVGGAGFQMWQTQLGSASLMGAFQFTMQLGLVLLFVNMHDS